MPYCTRVQSPPLISSMRKAVRSSPRWSVGDMLTTPPVPMSVPAKVTLAPGATGRVRTRLPPRKSVFLDFVESVYLGKAQSLSLDDIYRVNEITIATHEASAAHGFLKI